MALPSTYTQQISQFQFPRWFAMSKPLISKILFLNPTLNPMISSVSFPASSTLPYGPFSCFCSILSSTPSAEHTISSPSKVFIKGLPLSTSEGRLVKAFSEFGEVSQVKLIMDKESGDFLGFAYIWFAKEESAQLAVKEMNGKFFDGRFIYVTIAKPESSKSWRKTSPYKF